MRNTAWLKYKYSNVEIKIERFLYLCIFEACCKIFADFFSFHFNLKSAPWYVFVISFYLLDNK